MNSLARNVGTADPIGRAVAAAASRGLFDGWTAQQETGSSFWWEYRPLGARSPDTGFKIHLSSSLATAGEVLERALPVLLERHVPFKHAAGLPALGLLSSGRGGITQIGKFLTAYPPDRAAAAELAELLHEATRGLPGPRIRSEAAFAEGSLVHCRYGGFARRTLQLLTGRIVPAMIGPRGALEPDERAQARGSAAAHEPLFADRSGAEAHLLRGRYLRVQRLYQGPKGASWVGFDMTAGSGDLLVIKEAYAWVLEGGDGVDARERLLREGTALEALQTTGLVPVIRAIWQEEESAFLIYEFVEGHSFLSVLNGLAAEGLRPTPTLLAQWTEGLCGLVSAVHRHDYVIGDLKPANLILGDEGFRLIDLELAAPCGSGSHGGMGTRGYASPQQAEGRAERSFQDDIYSLGATLLAARLTMDCSIFPNPLAVARLERTRNPRDSFYAVIEACLAPDPRGRFKSARAVLEALRTFCPGGAHAPAEVGLRDSDFFRLAVEVGDLLIGSAVREQDSVWWVSPHPVVGNEAIRDLYAGSSGTALFLCELYAATLDERYLASALDCARWLEKAEPAMPSSGDMPGLYYGICGPGLLFLRLSALTGDFRWRDLALAVGERAAGMSAHSPDLMTGRAGTGLFYLALWKMCGHVQSRERGLAEARALLACCDGDRPSWTMPAGHEGLSGNAYVGFAHGSAGIGYFLAECALIDPQPEIVFACSWLADWIVDLGRPCLADGSGLTWGIMADDAPSGFNWCHGAPGVARFLLKMHRLTGNPVYFHAVEAAARSIAHASWLGPTQCHGLAGNADVLVDVWQQSRDALHLRAARRLGENLAAFRREGGWPSEDLLTVCPDLMVGQAGVGAALLRLARPELAHLVSI